MAILENRPHFASAVAKTTCQLLPSERKRFQFLVEQTPNFAFDVMEMMAEWLHHMQVNNSPYIEGLAICSAPSSGYGVHTRLKKAVLSR